MAGNAPNAGNDLLRIHKVITRAITVSLLHCSITKITEELRKGFETYVRVLTILLHSHHLGEDEISFPFWMARLPDGPFNQLSLQHKQMIVILELIEKWLSENRKELNGEDMNRLHGFLSNLQKNWLEHIALEESTIGPDNSFKHLTPDENIDLVKKLAEHGQAHSQPAEIVMPFVVYNLDETDRNEFIRLLPPVMTQQLIPVAWKAHWEPMIPFLLIQ